MYASTAKDPLQHNRFHYGMNDLCERNFSLRKAQKKNLDTFESKLSFLFLKKFDKAAAIRQPRIIMKDITQNSHQTKNTCKARCSKLLYVNTPRCLISQELFFYLIQSTFTSISFCIHYILLFNSLNSLILLRCFCAIININIFNQKKRFFLIQLNI